MHTEVDAGTTRPVNLNRFEHFSGERE